MRILVTGAEGFIGSHLSEELTQAGHTVLGVDRDYADLAVPGEAERVIDRFIPEYVVHLAARYGRLLCRDKPHQSVTDNAAATTEIAAVCSLRGVPVLYTSSSEVYGDQGKRTITEKTKPVMPTTIYGLSKRWGEEALQLYGDPCIVRLNMLYGPRQRAGYGCCALATFIDCALEGEPFTVHRHTSRSWLYITDAVRALRLLIEEGHRGIYNLGNDQERMSLAATAEMVLAECGGEYELADPPADQIAHKNYSVKKLRSTIDWMPEVNLAEGIARTVEWAKVEGFRDYGETSDAERV